MNADDAGDKTTKKTELVIAMIKWKWFLVEEEQEAFSTILWNFPLIIYNYCP